MSVIGPRPQLVRDLVFMSKEERKRHTVATIYFLTGKLFLFLMKIISFPYKKAKGSLPEGCPDQE